MYFHVLQLFLLLPPLILNESDVPAVERNMLKLADGLQRQKTTPGDSPRTTKLQAEEASIKSHLLIARLLVRSLLLQLASQNIRAYDAEPQVAPRCKC